ncbi:MAG: hypothetical protein FJW66_01815 [Actinobacteria bacterium]|nr:hypothetical protein [Actinomycetota bacterium]
MFKDESEKLILNLPFGFRDIFPVEAQERKEIEDIIRTEFFSWGYGEVKTPIVEFTRNISAGVGKDWKDKLISLFDVDGNLISLRADMTIPIARLAGMRLKKENLPARFYYFANSFRQSAQQKGQKRVLNQAGLEFIGSDMLSADIEVLTILVNILRNLGIRDFKIALGHTKFIDGICKWFKLGIKEAEFVRENMILKNFVALTEFLDKKDTEKTEVFIDLLKPAKDYKTVAVKFSGIEEKDAQESVLYIRQVYKLLETLGINERFIWLLFRADV